ncbi:MAG TPA: lamin tail domain-containing protein [Candidatus Saccharimonadales bacterium]|nr:lamin tail domain-containing protein [Candidatus Saccharimonadales bacterium]
MRQKVTILRTVCLIIILASTLAFKYLSPVLADTSSSVQSPSLVISQLKMTSSNGQFITLYNTSGSTLDMSKYQLEYFNNYDLNKATSSKLISLTGSIPPHGYFMVNDDSLLLCYKLTVDSISLGLSSTAGLVEVLAFNQSSPGGSVSPDLQDFVGWSKSAATGAQTLPANTSAFLQRQPLNSDKNPLVVTPGAGSWLAVQPDSSNPCTLVNSGNNTVIQSGLNQLLPAVEPPSSIEALNGTETAGIASTAGVMPTADIGLAAPTLTELLPNPIGTGNDSRDEFIELYNSNNARFDLSGFSLQVGTTSLHNYTFPADSFLEPHSLRAFYSLQTGLSLSNSGGQAKLIDPFGNSISSSAIYSTAKDGQAWALANSKWFWTTKPTPNATNIINQPVTLKKSSSKTSKTKVSKIKATKPTKLKAETTAASEASGPLNLGAVHLWTLALIAGLALLYVAYEYRADVANRIYRFRQYIDARRGNGS